MNFPIQSLTNLRTFVLQTVADLSDEVLNTIPEGFNNNIIWNLAHLVAAEQGVLYVRGGAQPRIDPDFLKTYTRGTKPEGIASSADIAMIKSMMTSTLPQLAADYEAGVFNNYRAWTTPYGVELTNIDEAAQFILFHEGLHCGCILALKRAIAAAAVNSI